ncbi:DUF799 domain-containing protein [Campylobacter mucosalis]|uniref:DUF799 domain-containing protein n=1 Tax=Campylobacter mucosalis TaxID=202 RepID=UPI0014705748|nr:DUF799 domain-containing protein [Campylobacter mucosalis]
MRILNLALFSLIALLFSACAKPQPYDYSEFLSAKPKSILVLPPTNQTTDIKAPASILANSLIPLSEAGYYVYPMALVYDTFKNNGVSEADEIAKIPLPKLREIFNADSVLYLDITDYGTKYVLLSSYTIVGVSAKLFDLRSQKLLWQKSAYAQTDSGGGNSGIVGMLISAVVTQIANSISDASYDLANQAMWQLYAPDCSNCLLRGYRAKHFGEDVQLKN